jgi:putative ABC transport system permease protein
MSTLTQDFRYAARTLAKSPGFTAVALATLALGIGATTAIFSVVDGVLLRSLPYPEPDRLLAVSDNVSALDLADLKAGAPAFEAAGGAASQPLDLTGDGEPTRVAGALVADSLFEVLGARAAAGRPLSRLDDQFGAERVVAISHEFWQQRWGSNPAVVGRALTLGGQPYTVVGVLTSGFELPDLQADVFVPLRVGYPDAARYRGVHFLRSCWRLKPGIGLARAQAELDAVAGRLAVEFPDENKGRRFVLASLLDRVVGPSRAPLAILFGAVALVLLIACANLANLLLARAASRRSELSIRAALGAGRSRLMRQLLTESLLLGLLGGAFGLLAAGWVKDLLLARMPAGLPRAAHVAVDGRVALFALGVSAATGLLFGLLPAWRAARADVADGLRGGRTVRGGSARLRAALVVSELALAFALLAGAALLLRAFGQMRAVDPGFDPTGVLTVSLELPEARYREVPEQTRLRQRLLAALNAPPFDRAAMVSEIPLGGSSLDHNVIIEGRPPVPKGEEPDLVSRSVMGDYFSTMRIPLRRGRDLAEADREGAPLVGVVNEKMARVFFAGESPIGRRIRWARAEGEPRWIEIVGVVGDVTHYGLAVGEHPAIYTPYAQSMQAWKRWMQIVIRTRAAGDSAGTLLRQRIGSVDPLLPVSRIRSLQEVVSSSLARQRFQTQLLTAFAAAALLLAAVGIAGVMATSVKHRTAEIGVRMALGARPGRVLADVLGQGLRLVALGIGIGFAAALACSHLLAGFLFGVRPTDLSTYAAAAAVLALAAMAACLVPALRATRIDPIAALRAQ